MHLFRTVVSVCSTSLIVLDILFASLAANAEPVSQAQMANYEKGFGALQQNTHTFSANIVQTLTLQGLSQPLVSKGTLYYITPDRLLIRFSQPADEWTLVNGSQVAVQKQGKPLDLHDLSSQGKNSSHTASLLDFFRSGPAHWHQDFDVSMTREGDHLLVHLKPWMTPTSTFQGVDSIVTTLQLPSYEILSMEIAMSGANQIRYDFLNVKRNSSIDSSLFALPKEDSTP